MSRTGRPALIVSLTVRWSLATGQIALSLALLIAARHFDAQYSWNAHFQKAIEAGVARDALEALAQRRTTAFQVRDEQAVYAFCSELLDRHFVAYDTFAEAHELFGDQGVVDLVGTLGNFSMLAMCLNAFEVDLQADREPPFGDVGPGRKVPSRLREWTASPS